MIFLTERHTSNEHVLMHTKAESALLAHEANVSALRQLFAELLPHPESVCMVAAAMAGADVRYDMGEEHPAAPTGWFAPPLRLVAADGSTRRLAELLRDARPLLLDITDGEALAATAVPWAGRVQRVDATAAVAR